MAYQTPLTIAEVVNDISFNKYVLPSIQREYVWKPEQIQTLFDSLMQGYPIGAFLFWEIGNEKIREYDFYEFLKHYHEKNATHNQKVNLNGTSGVTAVLDGQQRLTSLYIGLKGSYAYHLKYRKKDNANAYPARKLYLNLVAPSEDETNEYDFRFIVPSDVVNSNNQYWFEVGNILQMDVGSVAEYVNDNISFSEGIPYTKEQSKYALNTLMHLHHVIREEGTISYYKEKSEELDKVLNIFIRVNSGGTVLSYSDLLLSIASAQWEKHDAREEIIEFVDSVNSIGAGFNIDKDFVLKSALVLSDFSNIAFKVDNFNKANMMKIEENWDKLKEAITLAVKLVSSFGYSKETLSSNATLIPIAYYLMTIGIPADFVDSSAAKSNRIKIKKWLIRSLLKRAFSGQPDNVLRPIRDVIRENGHKEFPLEGIIEKFKGHTKSILFTDDDIEEHLLELSYGKSETLSTLMILYPHLDYKNYFHIDHMYPKSKFTKQYLRSVGIEEEKINDYIASVNSIANLQLLQALPNMEKSDTDFDVWFNESYPTEAEKVQYRDTHYLPDMEYSYDNFMEFIKKRRTLIMDSLKEALRYDTNLSEEEIEVEIETPVIEEVSMEEMKVEKTEDSNEIYENQTEKVETNTPSSIHSKLPVTSNTLKKVAHDWFVEHDDNIIEIIAPLSQRQLVVTRGLESIVPQASIGSGPHGSGYYATYEIEIRPNKAVVRLMCCVDKWTPSNIIDIYKNVVLPKIGKIYRDDGQYYNITFNSMKVTENTTRKEMIEFLEKAFDNINKFEASINL